MNEMIPYTLPLADSRAVALAITGGKGASLAKMAAADLPVPAGFHITTAAYDHFVAVNELQPKILAAMAAADPEHPDTLAIAENSIRPLFVEGTIPAELAQAITQRYRQLSEAAVAVRSSATAEDLPDASFAGQQETFLNVQGDTAVLAAVKQCWSSLWTARAIGYRARQGVDPGEVSLAVVVQRLVPAETAGILFTANPMNGRRDQMLINAAWGLGEAIVGGQVMPDQWVINTGNGQVVSTEIAAKQVMTVCSANGTTIMQVPAEKQETAVLNAAELNQLTNLAQRVANHYDTPQDVEWVQADGHFFIVQSRPITALFPLPEPLPSADEGLRIYMCLNIVAQGITEPFTPMGLEMFRLLYVGMTSAATGKSTDKYPSWAKLAAGRMYLDLTSLLRSRSRWASVANNLGRKDPVAGEILHQLLARSADDVVGRPGFKLPWRLLLKIFPRLTKNAVYGYLRPVKARQKLVAMGDEFLARLADDAAACDGISDRLRFVETYAEDLFWQLLYQVAYCSAGIRLTENGPQLVERWLGDGAAFHPVAEAIPYNPTTEMGLALLRIARQFQAEAITPTADHPAVQTFLQQYGHRAIQEIDMGVPRWREQPEYVLEMIASYMNQGDPETKLEDFATAMHKAERAIDDIVLQVRQRKTRLTARLAQHLLRCARELAGLRERPKFDMIRSFALFHEVIRDVGQILVEQGRLEQPTDVFFLTFADIESEADLRATAAANRTLYDREMVRRHVPRIMTSTGESLYGVARQTEDGALLGTAVSPGSYEGLVRVVHTPLGAELQAGEVLVTHSTDPGWTPLFLNAGALIMETGGPISHGAIVAREYGIPAVAGVAEATTRLQTGSRVRVDGEQGTVEILEVMELTEG